MRISDATHLVALAFRNSHFVPITLYNPLTSNWGETILVAGHPPKASDEIGSSGLSPS
jgi:hypothetical protein